MRFDLEAAARRAGNRKGDVTLPAIFPPHALETDLLRTYMKVVRAWSVFAKERLMPAYRRALERLNTRDGLIRDDATEFSGLFEQYDPEIRRLLLSLTPELREWVFRTEAWQRSRWSSNVLTATGVDLTTILGPIGVQQTLAESLAWNVSLIADVSAKAQGSIANAVFAAFRSRTPARELAKQINEILGGSKRRAQGIASDQLNKLSAALDDERGRQSGLEEWKWRHSGKAHPRVWHKERDGNIYTAKTAPRDMPSTLPWCGCKQQWVLRLD